MPTLAPDRRSRCYELAIVSILVSHADCAASAIEAFFDEITATLAAGAALNYAA
jgi:hypothetical protein